MQQILLCLVFSSIQSAFGQSGREVALDIRVVNNQTEALFHREFVYIIIKETNIKSSTCFTISITNGVRDTIRIDNMWYNDHGRLTKYLWNDKGVHDDPSKYNYYTNTYDKFQNIISVISGSKDYGMFDWLKLQIYADSMPESVREQREKDLKERIDEIVFFSYDSVGNPTKMKRRSDNYNKLISYELNEKGLFKKLSMSDTMKDSTNKSWKVCTFEYNDRNQPTKIHQQLWSYDGSAKGMEKILDATLYYKYDTMGNNIESLFESGKKIETTDYIRVFNSNNQCIKLVEVKNKIDTLDITTYKYDGTKVSESSIVTSDSERPFKPYSLFTTTYKYHSDGKLKSEHIRSCMFNPTNGDVDKSTCKIYIKDYLYTYHR